MTSVRPHSLPHSRREALAIASLLLIGCSDSTQPKGGGGGSAEEKIRSGVLVSGPLSRSSSERAAAIASPDPDVELIYVSMPPGTLDGGDSVRLETVGFATAVASGVMGDGGFDPIPVNANSTDSIDVAVFRGGTATSARVRVPAFRQPSVIRTTPPRGRTDVPLNQGIIIVFSQPLALSTVTSTSVQLTSSGSQVPATVTVDAGQPWLVRMTPAVLLAPTTIYSIVIDGTIKDVNGLSLVAPLSSDFTTGSTVGSVASISVSQFDGFGRGLGKVAQASPGSMVSFVASKVSAAGDTLTSSTGAALVWSSSDPSVAVVGARPPDDVSDTVTAIAPGHATISACSGTICGQGAIIVTGVAPGVAPTRIGDLGGGASGPADIDGPFIVGASTVPPDSTGFSKYHPFLWSAAHGMEDLGLRPGDVYGAAAFVNDSGAVIGFDLTPSSTAGNAITSNWIWRRDTGVMPLADPDIADAPWRLGGIDARGNIVFASSFSSAIAFLSPTTGMHFGHAPSAPTYAAGMNEHDQLLIGSFTPPTPEQRQAGYDSTSVCGPSGYIMDAPSGSIVETINPPRLLTGETLALCVSGINDAGMITGSLVRGAATLSPTFYPFRWTQARGVEALAEANGLLRHGDGVAVSNAGDVVVLLQEYVRSGSDSTSSDVAAVWTADGGLVRLGTLGGSTTFAIGMNDSRLVAGESQLGSNVGPLEAVVWDLRNVQTSSIRNSTISVNAAKWPPPSREAAGRPRPTSGLPRLFNRLR